MVDTASFPRLIDHPRAPDAKLVLVGDPAQLGERPEEGSERVAWDRAVRAIRGCRQRHRLLDRDTVLGSEAKDRATRRDRARVRGSAARAQRELGIGPAQPIERAPSLEIGP